MTRRRPTYELGRELHQLWFGADWACADRSLETLERIARRLATRAPRPLRRTLVIFAETCRRDPDRAVAGWLRLKRQIRDG